jgi:hypothetical protein
MTIGSVEVVATPAKPGLTEGRFGYVEMINESLARGRAGINRLLGRPQCRAPGAQRPGDALQVGEVPGQTIKAGDHQSVARGDGFEDGPKFLTRVSACTAALLGANDVAAPSPQRRLLEQRVLEGGFPNVSDDGHSPLSLPLTNFLRSSAPL